MISDAPQNTDTSVIKKATSAADSEQNSWRAWLWLFFLSALASLAWLIYSFINVNNYLSNVNQLEVSSTNIVQDINDATFSQDFNVSNQAYEKLQTDVQNYQAALTAAQSKAIADKDIFNELAADWSANKEQIDYVVAHINDVNALQDVQESVSEASKKFQSQYRQVTQQAVAAGLPAAAINDIQAQILRAERINTEMQALTRSTDGSSEAFKAQVTAFANTLAAQKRNYASELPALRSIEQTYQQTVAPVSEQLTTLNNPAVKTRENARALSNLAQNTQNKLSDIDRNLLTRGGIILPMLAFLLSLLGLMYAFYRLLNKRGKAQRLLIEKETMRQRQEADVESERARKIQEENERNQMAILRLLDELGDLAEGDLTVNATVSEDFTGAIADSVNFAIDQLRQLVMAINTTADRVAKSSEQTQMNAVELAEASEHQAQEIAGVSAAINEMAISIDQVSANASESASVANRSVAIAHNGAEVVQRSIEGMNVIRDQIQETSKRIKRLGESSQEIGDIVSLINDIADQTNILALNAAIQASMAGEAGRGFAVVADEVQRLAERSANATKQIETLVRTIQADTNEAVMSMESTTSEVVRGARLAKDAGEALEEVQGVSHTLADLIQNISNAAQQQADSAGHISDTMNIIQDITSQTSSGTMATARSVGQLSEMAIALQESVSGFKLSDDDLNVEEDSDEFQVV
ncbi:methyl-accepting chemotaxis protein [Psychrobacter pygoscelis]|uniref:methyl-accepting chemotaxis protein n=1 Tax=Psychrobacter pygoscelis TaxID=2488563 RepID=UPI0024189473|nr:methyl-accepting chemotaxis protein [Psychrobacter pygoscelis]